MFQVYAIMTCLCLNESQQKLTLFTRQTSADDRSNIYQIEGGKEEKKSKLRHFMIILMESVRKTHSNK